MRDVRVAALDAHIKFKMNQFGRRKKQASLSGEHDSRGRGEKPPVLWAQDIPLDRGMG